MPDYRFHSDANQRGFEDALSGRLIPFQNEEPYCVYVQWEGFDQLAREFGGDRDEPKKEKK